jgi:hypothetical protein
MKRSIVPAILITTAAGAVLGAGVLAGRVLKPGSAVPLSPDTTWTEVSWPFPVDQWGKGKAYQCKSEHCGTDVKLYLRAKIGFCDCVSTIDDDEVDRVGDVDLVGGARAALGPGRPIAVRWMKGRSRGYALAGSASMPRSALGIAFHDRCDMIVATAAIAGGQPAAYEDAVLAFLNSDRVLRWAEVTLGL